MLYLVENLYRALRSEHPRYFDVDHDGELKVGLLPWDLHPRVLSFGHPETIFRIPGETLGQEW